MKTYVVSAHYNCLKAILMSTHNIGFYEEMTKTIFHLSSDITKYQYAAYLFFCYFDALSSFYKAELLDFCLQIRIKPITQKEEVLKS